MRLETRGDPSPVLEDVLVVVQSELLPRRQTTQVSGQRVNRSITPINPPIAST